MGFWDRIRSTEPDWNTIIEQLEKVVKKNEMECWKEEGECWKEKAKLVKEGVIAGRRSLLFGDIYVDDEWKRKFIFQKALPALFKDTHEKILPPEQKRLAEIVGSLLKEKIYDPENSVGKFFEELPSLSLPALEGLRHFVFIPETGEHFSKAQRYLSRLSWQDKDPEAEISILKNISEAYQLDSKALLQFALNSTYYADQALDLLLSLYQKTYSESVLNTLAEAVESSLNTKDYSNLGMKSAITEKKSHLLLLAVETDNLPLLDALEKAGIWDDALFEKWKRIKDRPETEYQTQSKAAFKLLISAVMKDPLKATEDHSRKEFLREALQQKIIKENDDLANLLIWLEKPEDLSLRNEIFKFILEAQTKRPKDLRDLYELLDYPEDPWLKNARKEIRAIYLNAIIQKEDFKKNFDLTDYSEEDLIILVDGLEDRAYSRTIRKLLTHGLHKCFLETKAPKDFEFFKDNLTDLVEALLYGESKKGIVLLQSIIEKAKIEKAKNNEEPTYYNHYREYFRQNEDQLAELLKICKDKGLLEAGITFGELK